MNRFNRKIDFASLGILDLLQARDLYHAQLAMIPNVIGTAIGRYLIRTSDPTSRDPNAAPPANLGARYLNNSVVTQWSWPAVLVFVTTWVDREVLRSDPTAYVPPRLYLPDGRAVPTCVVASPLVERAARTIGQPEFSAGSIGPGNAILRVAQDEERVGTVGCLATDGADIFALTSSHVVGQSGEPLYGFDASGERVTIGTAAAVAQRNVVFEDAYLGWPGVRSKLTVDVGMIRLSDVSGWTAQIRGLRRMGPIIDLSIDTLNLDLIGCPLRGYGAASDEAEGQVLALFYRYATIGGTDDIADLLIAPRQGADSIPTRPGDSGAVWVWDAEADVADGRADTADPTVRAAIQEPRPLALQWGGYGATARGGQSTRQFALATSLSLACRLLEVQYIRDLGFERGQYWGKTGHYKVAYSACDLVGEPKLKALLLANRDNIAVSDGDLAAGKVPMNNDKTFIALADVADLYWRSARPNDAANHFADMDDDRVTDPRNARAKTSLLDAWSDPATRTTAYWNAYYDNAGTDDAHKGALPFRVWEIYDALVGYAKEGRVAEFVCAAGCVAHYIGDACQPLHVSYLHHGDPQKPAESPVHATYETKMLDANVNDLIAFVNAALHGKSVKKTFSGGGAEAANQIVALMGRTLKSIDPREIIALFDQNSGQARLPAMWSKLGKRTAGCIADGALTLATYWQSAWEEGRNAAGAAALPRSLRAAIPERTLMNLYRDKTFVPSRLLKNMSLPPPPSKSAGAA